MPQKLNSQGQPESRHPSGQSIEPQARSKTRMTTKEYLLYGLVATTTTTLDDISITGNTYNCRDLLKSLGAKWSPEQKAWKVFYGTDLSVLRPPPPPPKPRFQPLPAKAYRGGSCCRQAKTKFDDENPQGPLWYICPVHGTWKSCYTGD